MEGKNFLKKFRENANVSESFLNSKFPEYMQRKIVFETVQQTFFTFCDRRENSTKFFHPSLREGPQDTDILHLLGVTRSSTCPSYDKSVRLRAELDPVFLFHLLVLCVLVFMFTFLDSFCVMKK